MNWRQSAGGITHSNTLEASSLSLSHCICAHSVAAATHNCEGHSVATRNARGQEGIANGAPQPSYEVKSHNGTVPG